MVGALYEGQPARAATPASPIFYMGINLGAFVGSSLVAGDVGEELELARRLLRCRLSPWC